MNPFESAIITQVAAELQALGAVDVLTVATLAALEGILSVDNALVLAILVRTLPKSQQKKALTYGIAGAFIFRFLAIIFAAYLMRMMVFKLIGGGYLVYLAMKHMFFFREDGFKPAPKTATNFWKTVAVVELTDIAFSIDSITTAVAMTDKIIVVWFGGILGIIFLRFAAGFFVKLLGKLPRLEDLAYQLIFFIGTKLFLEAFHVEIELWVFWMVMGIIAVLGSSLVYKDYHQRKTHTRRIDRLIERLEAGELTVDELAAMDTIPGEVLAYLRENGRIKPAGPPEARQNHESA